MPRLAWQVPMQHVSFPLRSVEPSFLLEPAYCCPRAVLAAIECAPILVEQWID